MDESCEFYDVFPTDSLMMFYLLLFLMYCRPANIFVSNEITLMQIVCRCAESERANGAIETISLAAYGNKTDENEEEKKKRTAPIEVNEIGH